MSPPPYTQEQLPDPRNAGIMIHVGGSLLLRDQASVSVFDSVVQGGDAVWEGLRVYQGRIAAFEQHLDRLFDSAHALRFLGVPSRHEVRDAVFSTLAANAMSDGVHIRLTLTRGPKVTSGMSPNHNQAGCTLIVLAEWKPPVFDQTGIRLITSAVRRNSPATLDSKIHHNNLLNNILAKIQADIAGVDDAIMLDINGFVSETNATNLFAVKHGVVLTPHADACLPGITRQAVVDLAAGLEIPLEQRNVSLAEVHTADEVFTTGTMGELAPVIEVDGRQIGNGEPGNIVARLQAVYLDYVNANGTVLPQ